MSGAVAAALITGDRSAIPSDALSHMRDAGLAHPLAISGLHLGLVATILFFVTRAVLACFEPVALRWPIKKIAALMALI
ncbi:MAG: ComEC/Rec2 family competence protein, partial [Alphaproteobacteria bacterium]